MQKIIITDSEYEIMKIIWKEHPIGSKMIINELSTRMEWTAQTIKTLINRLLKKEAITYVKQGKSYLYSPLVDRDSYLKQENESFMKKFYNNSINDLLCNFVKNQKLSEKEIDELKALLNESAYDK
jgi:BlaI family penicillinase repressor